MSMHPSKRPQTSDIFNNVYYKDITNNAQEPPKSFKTSHLGNLKGKSEENNTHYYSSGRLTGGMVSVAD